MGCPSSWGTICWLASFNVVQGSHSKALFCLLGDSERHATHKGHAKKMGHEHSFSLPLMQPARWVTTTYVLRLHLHRWSLGWFHITSSHSSTSSLWGGTKMDKKLVLRQEHLTHYQSLISSLYLWYLEENEFSTSHVSFSSFIRHHPPSSAIISDINQTIRSRLDPYHVLKGTTQHQSLTSNHGFLYFHSRKL